MRYFVVVALLLFGAMSLFAAQESTKIQMLVPGFSVQELPLDIRNVNNLNYSDDGRLFALCYDGNVYQLKDTDGDGLEETAVPYYKNEKGELNNSIGMTWGPKGLYITSHGRVVTLSDVKEGLATLETLTTGWVKPHSYGGSGLDATGVAVDKEGNVYFGLCCDLWNNIYRVDKATDKSQYDIKSERGTILKLPAGGDTREIICTGLRFTIALAFNKHGALFCTDQEGATWCPGGNPLDEVNFIQKGKQYGFPPRHEKYLPDVVDEPPAVAYGPQHQSTCGLKFNEAKPGWKHFGPDFWEGDAIVTGFARGKLWRSKLQKTPKAGYLSTAIQFASLDMMPSDIAISPKGDLYVACHSGKPDWGTGPTGKGTIFKISYVNPAAPQPTGVFAPNVLEVQVFFDKPFDVASFDAPVIDYGEFVGTADRLEHFRPIQYDAVKLQQAAERRKLSVRGSTLSADKKTLTIKTDVHPWRTPYALQIPNIKPTDGSAPYDIDLLYDFNDGSRVVGTGPTLTPPAPVMPKKKKELAGGDWQKGKELFYGNEAKCSACHTVREQGGKLGPDLSRMVQMDPEGVRREIVEPSASINPDFISYQIKLKNGTVLSGIARGEGNDKFRVLTIDSKDAKATQETLIDRADIEKLVPSTKSVMPEDYKNVLGDAKLKDILTFLCEEEQKK